MTPDECSALVRAAWPDREWTDEEVIRIIFDTRFFCWRQEQRPPYPYTRTPTPHMAELISEREAWDELIQRKDGAMYEAERAEALAEPQLQKLPLHFVTNNSYAPIPAEWSLLYFQQHSLFNPLTAARLESLRMKMEVPNGK